MAPGRHGNTPRTSDNVARGTNEQPKENGKAAEPRQPLADLYIQVLEEIKGVKDEPHIDADRYVVSLISMAERGMMLWIFDPELNRGEKSLHLPTCKELEVLNQLDQLYDKKTGPGSLPNTSADTHSSPMGNRTSKHRKHEYRGRSTNRNEPSVNGKSSRIPDVPLPTSYDGNNHFSETSPMAQEVVDRIRSVFTTIRIQLQDMLEAVFQIRERHDDQHLADHMLNQAHHLCAAVQSLFAHREALRNLVGSYSIKGETGNIPPERVPSDVLDSISLAQHHDEVERNNKRRHKRKNSGKSSHRGRQSWVQGQHDYHERSRSRGRYAEQPRERSHHHAHRRRKHRHDRGAHVSRGRYDSPPPCVVS